MMRKNAVVGDSLEHGGTILPYSAATPFLMAGHQVALIGGQAFCAKCKSTGTIAKAGGPRRMNFMGEVALEGDIVLCKCPKPPRVVATLAGDKWNDDMVEGMGKVPFNYNGFIDYLNDPQNKDIDDEDLVQYFEFVSSDSTPLEMHYAIHTPDGVAHEASLDNGKTADFPITSPVKMIAWNK